MLITGNAYFNFYSEPGKWNLSLGTYDKPNKLEFMDFVKCKSYFEMGHLARTFYPPLCAEAAKEFGYSGGDYSSDKESLKGGKGFAFAIGMFILPGTILSGGVAGITALLSNYIIPIGITMLQVS